MKSTLPTIAATENTGKSTGKTCALAISECALLRKHIPLSFLRSLQVIPEEYKVRKQFFIQRFSIYRVLDIGIVGYLL